MGPKLMRPKLMGKKKKEDDKEDLKLVDREFYNLQIEDLNRKLARLETKCTELETENEDLRKNMDKLNEDRADVISHLRRVLQRKIDEVNELTERIEALELAKEKEANLFKEKIRNMEMDFKIMHEQLTSEIKLLNGKLNSLDEFRSQREDLMNKFERQELAMEEQERRHDQQLLDLEQSYLVRKERLKEEMETRLLKLSLDFQKATQMRIASTTQSVIRENIAVNNQLNILVAEWKRMCEELEELKIANKNLLINDEIYKKEKKVIERKNIIQHEVIKKLAEEESFLKEQGKEICLLQKHIFNVECELSEARRLERLAFENLGVAKQQLHALAVSYNQLKIDQNKQRAHAFKLESVLTRGTQVVKNVLALSKPGQSDEGTILRRIELLKTLEELLDLDAYNQEFIFVREIEATETMGGAIKAILKEKYMTGDLGIVPPKIREEQSTESIEVKEPEKTWEDQVEEEVEEEEKSSFQQKKYIQVIEDMLVAANYVVKEIIFLPVAKTRLMQEEVRQRREELLNELLRTLDLSLIHTLRPQLLQSLETIMFPDGLLDSKLKFPTDRETMREYSTSNLLVCEEQSDEDNDLSKNIVEQSSDN